VIVFARLGAEVLAKPLERELRANHALAPVGSVMIKQHL
jgi:hypothetical protein